MPEGDTIWRTAAALRRCLLGQQVTAIRPVALERLAGSVLEEVSPVGKHLLMRFSCGWTLHTHMRITGSWHLYRPGEGWRKSPRAARAVLEFSDWVAVCFSAPLVELSPAPAAGLVHLGPDILGAKVDLGDLVRRARALGPVPLGESLLDQRVCCGVGNIHKCEALWELRLDPWLPSDALHDTRLEQFFATARRAMQANLRAGFERRFEGRQVFVEGRLHNNEFTDREGRKHRRTEVRVDEFQFLDPKPNGGSESPA